jgi:hypothetical protein
MLWFMGHALMTWDEMQTATDRKRVLKRELREACRCGRCQGEGVLGVYRQRNGGECYECQGTGVSTRGKGRGAKYNKLMDELHAIEARLAAHNAAVDASGAELPDLDTLDIWALVR